MEAEAVSATVAAHESAAEGPLRLPFQPRGAHATLRAFLGTLRKFDLVPPPIKKESACESIFFMRAPVARLAGVRANKFNARGRAA